jgi:hypothetical protein
MARRVGSDATTASTLFPRADDTPSRPVPKLAINTFGESCSNLLRIAAAPMSGAALEKVAPIAAAASAPIVASALLEAIAATRSPASMPIAWRWPARARTCSRSSRRVSLWMGPAPWHATTAIRSSSSGELARSRFSA